MKRRKSNIKSLSIYVLLLAALILGTLWLYGEFLKPQNTVQIYFFKNGNMTSVDREIPEKASPLYFTARQLLQGPTASEKKNGYFTQIPKGTDVRTIIKEDGTVRADFTKELEMYGGGTTKVQGIISQIVYTFTSLRGVKSVQIMVSGKKEVALGSEGYMIKEPLSRNDAR